MAEESGPVILIVDDDTSILEMVRAALGRHNGRTVLTATNGQDALKALREHDVTLLLTDVLMPGMNGTELVRQARQVKPNLRACLMSGFCEDDASGAGDPPLIQKPFDLAHLVRLVDDMLRPPASRKDPRFRI